MSGVANTIKMFLVPGSISFLVLGLIVGVSLLYGGKGMVRFGRRWLTGMLIVYALLSTPLGSHLLVAPLISHFDAIRSVGEARGATTVVVLSTGAEVYRAGDQEVDEMGKASAYNALEGARVYRLLQPSLVIASGGIVDEGGQQRSEGDIVAEGLVRLGVPSARIVVEGRSRTTREQAVYTAALLRDRHITTFVLVTAADHMARASSTFREQGLDPVPSVATFAVTTPPGFIHRLRPSLNALRQSDWGVYEYLARFYYWIQGWSGK